MVKTLLRLASLALLFSSAAAMAAGQSKDDATLTQELKTKITTDASSVNTASSPTVIIDTKDGKIFVYGIVDTTDQKKSVERIAKGIEGSKKVSTEIAVKNS